ncbi:MAG TPA: hypothetical protein VGK50_04140 [Coriobacteriia bacterium]|jgi:hypothetical protein
MSPILAGSLIVIGLVAALAVAVAAPLLVAVILREIFRTEESEPGEAEPSTVSIAMKRGGARAFVVAGGVFWSLASFAGLYSYHRTGLGSSLLAAFYPAAACAVTLVVGWYYERVVAILLVGAVQAVIVWGVLYEFELGVWVLMTLALIGPMLTAAVLFWLARDDQEAFEVTFEARPELHPLFSARSSLVPARIAA